MLDPPAVESPLAGPVGPGSGAVAQLPCIESGSRCANSPRFHGPVIHIAKKPRSNS